MSRHCDGFKHQVFLLFFLLLTKGNSLFLCGTEQNEANDVWHVWSGHNFSRRYSLKDPLLDTQIFVWTKGNSTWVKRYNGQCKSDEACLPSRYRMSKVSNVTFDLFIDYADETDSGHHVVTIYQGKQSICTALKMNLTVKTPEPICSTHLDNNDGKLQMSCQWVQMNEGDRAHFEVDSEVLYEHQIPEMNFQGNFKMTHWFSINVGLHRLAEEITERSKCVVSQRKGKAREMCNFQLVASKSFKQFEYTHNEREEFQCCVRNPDIPILVLYDGDGQEFPVSFRRNYTSRKDNSKFLLLCGAMEEHAVITVVNMKRLDISKSKKYESLTFGISVEDRKPFYNTSRENGRCKILTVNFTLLHSALNNLDDISTESLVTQNSDSFEATTTVLNTMTASPWTKNRVLLVAVAAIAASVFVFLVGACITNCYKYIMPGKHHCRVRRDTAGDRGPSEVVCDGERTPAVTTFDLQTIQQDGDAGYQGLVFNQVLYDHGSAGYQGLIFDQPPADEAGHLFKQESMGPCSGLPTLPLQREIIKTVSGGRPEGVKTSNDQQNAAMGSYGKPIPDSTYCSVDDVEDKPSRTGPVSSRQKAIIDDTKDTSPPPQELDELYAKPDMGHEFFQSIKKNYPSSPALNTNHAYHVYANATAIPRTDR